MSTFHTRLVTPERVLFEGDVSGVMLRTDVGEAAFLAGHAPLVGAVVPGLVRFQREDGSEERAAVHGGFVHVHDGSVVVSAPVAELAPEIDVERARRASDRAAEAGDEEARRRAAVRIEAAGS